MNSTNGTETSQLDYLYWRDEFLQVMYWMLGEGIASRPTIAQLESFVGDRASDTLSTLRRMAEEGYVTEVGGGAYALTDLGLSNGKRSFADEFREMTHQAHGECGPDCIFCHGPDADPEGCPSKVAHGAGIEW